VKTVGLVSQEKWAKHMLTHPWWSWDKKPCGCFRLSMLRGWVYGEVSFLW